MTLWSVSLLNGGWGLAISGVYLLALLGIGWLGRQSIRSQSMSEFFLAGRSLGPVVLLLTLFATQYSGNTLIGVPGQTYDIGYAFLVAVPMFVAIIAFAMVIAPGLQRLGQKHGYITTADVIHDRFRNRTLTTLVALVGLWALVNFLISNLIAVGLLVENATDGVVRSEVAIIGLALVMLVYETLGGLRAVAWTDMLQGSLILTGIVVISVAVFLTYGGPHTLHDHLSTSAPNLLAVPNAERKVSWASTLILVGVGAAIYPQAVQRYYSARNGQALRQSLGWMLVMPFIMATFAVLIGLSGRLAFPDTKDSDEITMLILGDLVRQTPWLLPVVVLFLTAVMAAIMSTVDSVLLAISATLTQDLYRPLRGKPISEAHLTKVGKFASWAMMAIAVVLAIRVEAKVWRLVEIKLEILLQAAPAVVLALYGRRTNAWAVVCGLIVGLMIAVAPLASRAVGGEWTIPPKLWGLHLGVLGAVVNAAVVWGCQQVWNRSSFVG